MSCRRVFVPFSIAESSSDYVFVFCFCFRRDIFRVKFESIQDSDSAGLWMDSFLDGTPSTSYTKDHRNGLFLAKFDVKRASTLKTVKVLQGGLVE